MLLSKTKWTRTVRIVIIVYLVGFVKCLFCNPLVTHAGPSTACRTALRRLSSALQQNDDDLALPKAHQGSPLLAIGQQVVRRHCPQRIVDLVAVDLHRAGH